MSPWAGARILLTTDAVGGVWSYSTTLAKSIAARGFQVLLVTLGPSPRPHQIEALGHHPRIDLHNTGFALEWMDPEGDDLARTAEGLRALADEFRPNIVHLNGFREAAADWQVPVLVAAHSCVWSWWQACRGCLPDEARWSAYAQNVRSGLATADLWISPTHAFRTVIEALYAPPGRSRVIHNGIGNLTESQAKRPVILAAGRLWDEAKNIAALTRVAADLEWPVQLAGPMEAGVNRIELDPHLDLLGELSRDRLLEVMTQAAIYTAPSLYEPFGLSVLEAAAAGCALVLSDTPSYRELWSGAALFVDARNDDDLRSTLRLLCDDSTLLVKLQRAARRRARRYSVKAMTAGYLGAYRSLLDEPRLSSGSIASEARI